MPRALGRSGGRTPLLAGQAGQPRNRPGLASLCRLLWKVKQWWEVAVLGRVALGVSGKVFLRSWWYNLCGLEGSPRRHACSAVTLLSPL